MTESRLQAGNISLAEEKRIASAETENYRQFCIRSVSISLAIGATMLFAANAVWYRFAPPDPSGDSSLATGWWSGFFCLIAGITGIAASLSTIGLCIHTTAMVASLLAMTVSVIAAALSILKINSCFETGTVTFTCALREPPAPSEKDWTSLVQFLLAVFALLLSVCHFFQSLSVFIRCAMIISARKRDPMLEVQSSLYEDHL